MVYHTHYLSGLAPQIAIYDKYLTQYPGVMDQGWNQGVTRPL